MSPRGVAGFLLLATAFALASWVGWWMVPLVAGLWGFLRPVVWRPIASAALAAALAWGAWLLADALTNPGSFARLGARLGAVMPLPFPLLLLLTLLLSALLAWSAAALGCWLSGALVGSREPSGR
jgi:hypothetical protein